MPEAVSVSQSTVQPAAALRSRMLQRALMLLVLVELLFVYAPTVAWLFDRWTMTVWHHAHGLLIPPVVAYFVYQELRALEGLPARGSAWGFAFLIPALALHILDTGMHTQLLSAVSIVIALPGLALLFLGTRRTAAIAFPLAFSAFALPIPLVFTERLHLELREIATFLAAASTPLLGITVYAQDTTLHLANATLIIGDACSGFSTLYAACAVAALVAYSSRSWRTRLTVLAVAPLLAIAANVSRIILLVVLVEWRGGEILNTWVHPVSGMLTFALSLPVILWLGEPREAVEAAR